MIRVIINEFNFIFKWIIVKIKLILKQTWKEILFILDRNEHTNLYIIAFQNHLIVEIAEYHLIIFAFQ